MEMSNWNPENESSFYGGFDFSFHFYGTIPQRGET